MKFTIDKTKKSVLTYSQIAANYRRKLILERTWLESFSMVLKNLNILVDKYD